MTTNQLVDEYLSEFTEHQRFVMNVAVEKLGSSFNVSKSNGFLKWKAKRQDAPKPASTPAPAPASTPEPVKKKRRVVKRKTPTTVHTSEQPTTSASPTIETQLREHFTKQDLLPQESFALPKTHKEVKPTHETGSIYCIFTSTQLLFVGTTSDTKKNLPLAYKGVLKAQEKEQEQSTVYAIIAPTEDNKKRIRVRDIIKKDLLRH